MASSAYATNIVLDYGSVHSGVGGEFVVKTDGTAASTAFVNATMANYNSLATYQGGFETFCIEYNEHFSPGSSYTYQVSPNAISTPSDPVSVGTAYLYSMFAQGSLSGYNYSSTTSAGNLQNTFWFLEGDQPSMPNTFLALLTTEFGSVAAAQGDSFTYNNGNVVNAASFGVAALNLGGIANNWPNQDQLVYQGRQNVPDGGTTLMLLGMAMGGMSLLRRKLS